MLFGEFLLDRGLVSSEQVIAALNEQRQSRPFTGVVACEMGYLDAREILEVLHNQMVYQGRFLDTAVELGFMSGEQATAVLREQGNRKTLLGKVLVQMGALTEVQLRRAIHDYSRRADVSPTPVMS